MSLRVNIKKQLGAFCLSVDFSAQSDTVALLGASGCGKSMTLKCIAGIVTPDSGHIELNGRVLYDSEAGIDLAPQKRRVGYLFQQYALFPNMSVEQNIAAGIPSGTRREKAAIVAREIARFRLQGLEKMRPYRLSGGQQQRVALARILVNKPEVLLLDEPFSALDSYLKWQLERELAEILSSYDGNVIFVSHSRDEVYRLCDSVCVLTDGVSEEKTSVSELFHTPRTVSAAVLSGCKNITAATHVNAHRVRCDGWGVTFTIAKEVMKNCSSVGIRAQYIDAAQEGDINSFTCRIAHVIDDVLSTVLILKTPGGEDLCVEMSKEKWAEIQGDETLCVAVSPDNIMLLE